MNRFKSLRAPVLLAAACSVLMACQTHGISEQTSQKLSYVQTEIGLGRATVTEATASLKMLRVASDAQIKPAAEIYSKSVTSLDEKAQGVGFVLNMTEQRASDYFDRWDKSITDLSNADMQQSAVERKTELSAAFDKVHTRIKTLRTSFKPFMNRLKDIQKTMTADPTAAGRAAAEPDIRAVLDQEGTILHDIDALDRELERLKKR